METEKTNIRQQVASVTQLTFPKGDTPQRRFENLPTSSSSHEKNTLKISH